MRFAHFRTALRISRSLAFLLLFSSALFLIQQQAHSQASTSKAPTAATKSAKAKSSSLERQIGELRKLIDNQANQIQNQASQIEGLKTDMAAKDEQLKHAEQAAADAQAAASRAENATQNQREAETENVAVVSSLQSAVSGLTSRQASLDATVTSTAAKMKALEGPAALQYKGITITPYGFLAGESAFRTHATGGQLVTPWSSLPYEGADEYSMSEMTVSGTQSRVGFIAEGKVGWGTMRGLFEGDFLGAGASSNDNQSTSYLFRQRILAAEAETNSHWTFSGGQGWSLTAENRAAISTAPTNIALPLMVDPNYVAGLVWSRMGFLRVTKEFGKATLAVSAENPQLLYTASLAGNTPYAVIGSAGTSGSALNNTVSSCSPSTSIVNYTNQKEIDSAGNTADVAVPVYKTVNACTNLANISFNKAPDVVVKLALDPGFGHWEFFAVGRTFQETVYPGETTNSNLYGGYKDIVTGQTVAPALTTAGAFSNSVYLGGIGASGRAMIKQKLILGAKALFGPGVGHFGASNLSDATSNASGELVPIHNLIGLLTVELNPTSRWTLYGYYGGDYAGREDWADASATTLGAPVAEFCVTGTTTCTTTPTAAQIAAGGSWGAHWAAQSAAAVGYGSRLLSNSACNTATAPGYNGSSTGYYAGASCGAQTRDVQEGTFGYWYDLYRGDRGRLRQGIQYSYAAREGWSGAEGIGAKGIENMVFTSFRYYLP